MTLTIPLTTQIHYLGNPPPEKEDHFWGVFITTNELWTEKTQEYLKESFQAQPSCHFGFSGWHNFDIMVLKKSSYAVLCDVNPKVTRFLEKTLKNLECSESIDEFIQKTILFVRKDECAYTPGYDFLEEEDPAESELKNETSRAGSWLSTQGNFNYIKKLALQNKIAVLTKDIRESQDFSKIAKLLRNNCLVIKTLYVSNIFQYQRGTENKEAFLKTVKALSQDDTLIISASHMGKNHGDLYQSVFRGIELKNKNLFQSLSSQDLEIAPPPLTTQEVETALLNWASETVPFAKDGREELRTRAANKILSFLSSYGTDSELCFQGYALSTLSDIWDYPAFAIWVEDLNLAGNNLSDLPESFSSLINLKKLSLAHNEFKAAPKSLEGLSSLEELDLSGNKLSQIESIKDLRNLKVLDCSYNNGCRSTSKLQSFPNPTNLLSLRVLSLYNCAIQHLDENLFKIKNLEKLELGDNWFQELSPSIKNLVHLKTLNLFNCHFLKDLPKELLQLKDSCTVNLRACSLAQSTKDRFSEMTGKEDSQ